MAQPQDASVQERCSGETKHPPLLILPRVAVVNTRPVSNPACLYGCIPTCTWSGPSASLPVVETLDTLHCSPHAHVKPTFAALQHV